MQGTLDAIVDVPHIMDLGKETTNYVVPNEKTTTQEQKAEDVISFMREAMWRVHERP